MAFQGYQVSFCGPIQGDSGNLSCAVFKRCFRGSQRVSTGLMKFERLLERFIVL